MDNKISVREAYKTVSKSHTNNHLVQSREIATTCVCPYLFKMSYPFGVSPGERDYLEANTVHDIISLAMPTTVLDNWHQGEEKKEANVENIARSIDRDSASIVEKAILDRKELAKREGKKISEHFEYEVQDRFHGLLIGIAKKLMKKYRRPKRAVTEITITNVKSFQEGRIDAILEFDEGYYGLIDWKTNNIERFTGSGIDKWQLIANFLLANYRYTGNEDDWSRCLFGSVVYYENAYFPRLPLKQDIISKVKNDRTFAHAVLCGKRPHTQKPAFCPVCDRDDDNNNNNGDSSSDCRFYREDSMLASQGLLPSNYANIRAHLIKRRYLVLDDRSETYKHKFVINKMIDGLGAQEAAALQELEKADVIYSGYRLGLIEGNSITLVKDVIDNTSSDSNNNGSNYTENNTVMLLEPRKVVRIIGKEDHIPLLACVNESGFVKELDDTKLVIVFDGNIPAIRANEQLRNLSIVLIRDEINLTRRTLEPMHRFHRLAADIMLPTKDDDNNNGEVRGKKLEGIF